LQYVVDPYLLRDISLLLQTVWTLVLRLFLPRSVPVTYSVDWNSHPSEEIISNAHRAQPSAD